MIETEQNYWECQNLSEKIDWENERTIFVGIEFENKYFV